MAKYHITENGPKICNAREGFCPITKETKDAHFHSQEMAQQVYEKRMSEQMGAVKKFQKLGFGTDENIEVNENKNKENNSDVSSHVDNLQNQEKSLLHKIIDEKIAQASIDFNYRDERQFTNTVNQQMKRNIDNDLLEKTINSKIRAGENGIGFLRTSEKTNQVFEKAKKQLHSFLLSNDVDAVKVRTFLGDEVDLEQFSEIITSNVKSMKLAEKFKNERKNSPMIRIVLTTLNNDMTKERYVASILFFGGKCCYCHSVLTKSTSGRAKKSDASGEHLTPVSPDDPNAIHGGTRFGNVVLACVGCNSERQNTDLEEWLVETRRIKEEDKPSVMGKIKAFRRFALYSDYTKEESKIIDSRIEELNNYLQTFQRDTETLRYSEEDANKIKERVKIVLYDLQQEIEK